MTWLLVAMLVQAIYGARYWLWPFLLFVLAEWAGRVVVIDTALTWPDLVGACIALAIWLGLPATTHIGRTVIAISFAAMVMMLRLQPFQFQSQPVHPFGWVPFWSLMHGSMNVAIPSFCEKFVQYGGLIWLLAGADVPLAVGTGLTAAMLLLTSYAEIYLPGRSGEMTDAMLALCIGGLFALMSGPRLSGQITDPAPRP